MAKKNSVPARHHQYVKRKKKFIEMPKEQLIKICAIAAAVILVAVLGFVLWNALDGHLDVVDGVVVTEGDNWIVANARTSSNPRYFKLGEAGEVEGFTREVDTTMTIDSNTPSYKYTPVDESSAIDSVTVLAGGGKYIDLVNTVRGNYVSFFPDATLSEISEADIAGRRARSFAYNFSYENTPAAEEPEATPDPEATPEPEAAGEADAAPASYTYTRGMYACLESGHGRSIVVTVSASASSEEELPDDAALKDAIDRVAAQIKFE